MNNVISNQTDSFTFSNEELDTLKNNIKELMSIKMLTDPSLLESKKKDINDSTIINFETRESKIIEYLNNIICEKYVHVTNAKCVKRINLKCHRYVLIIYDIIDRLKKERNPLSVKFLTLFVSFLAECMANSHMKFIKQDFYEYASSVYLPLTPSDKIVIDFKLGIL